MAISNWHKNLRLCALACTAAALILATAFPASGRRRNRRFSSHVPPNPSASSSAPRLPCTKPDADIPKEPAANITRKKSCGWGYFRNEIQWSTGPGMISISDLANGYRVSFRKDTDTWLGLYYSFRECWTEDAPRPTARCADLTGYNGVEFKLLGNAKLRFQVNEGAAGEYGEVYDTFVFATPQAITHRISFTPQPGLQSVALRTTWQPEQIMSRYRDGRLDLNYIQGLAWEALCPNQHFDCGVKQFEVWDIRLF